MPQIIVGKSTAHLANYTFFTRDLVNIKIGRFDSSINHQKHFFTEHVSLAAFAM